MPRPPQTEGLPPPHVGYASFVTFLDHLNTFGDPPNVINNRVFPTSFSGTTIALTLRALRFFSLTEDDGKPDVGRLRLLMNPETRRETMAELLNEGYPELIALPLATAGPGEIRDYFAAHVTDPTAARKARSFFIQAAKANGLPIHGSVDKVTRTRSRPGRRKTRDKSQTATNGAENGGTTPQGGSTTGAPAAGSTKVVKFRSGGTATLTVSVDVISLSPSDRKKLFEWIDAMSEYENETQAAT